MTIGVYKIYLGEENRYYIGQSSNILIRDYAHKSLLKNNKHYNIKLQVAYNTTNHYEFTNIEECSLINLDSIEEKYIKEYNSVFLGYNICSAGKAGKGLEHGSTKYSKDQIIETFLLCTNPLLTFKEIGNITGISESSVRHIVGREVHSWLDEMFPDQSKLLINLRKDHVRSSAIRSTKHKFDSIVSPEGIIYSNIPNLIRFGREHNLDPNKVGAVLLGNRNHHKGWKGLNNGS